MVQSHTPQKKFETLSFEVRLCGGTQVIKTPWGAGIQAVFMDGKRVSKSPLLCFANWLL